MRNDSVTTNKEKIISIDYEEETKDSESSSDKRKKKRRNPWHQFLEKNLNNLSRHRR